MQWRNFRCSAAIIRRSMAVPPAEESTVLRVPAPMNFMAAYMNSCATAHLMPVTFLTRQNRRLDVINSVRRLEGRSEKITPSFLETTRGCVNPWESHNSIRSQRQQLEWDSFLPVVRIRALPLVWTRWWLRICQFGLSQIAAQYLQVAEMACVMSDCSNFQANRSHQKIISQPGSTTS